MPYIYKITNQINNKCYIGKTMKINPYERWKEHQREKDKPSEQHRAIYCALNKYKIENFTFEIIEEVSQQELNAKEQYYIQHYNSFHNGYNETLGGDGTAYLELPEQDICQYYLKCLSIQDTADFFNHDWDTIKQVLYKYKIPLLQSGEWSKINQGNAVVQIDKNTNEIIKIFSTVGEADKATGGSKHIGSVCQGKRKTAAGYKWKYVTDIIAEQEKIRC